MGKKQKISIAILVIGIITLIVGLAFLIVSLTIKPAMRDGDYLTSAENWVLEDEPSVIWTFSEIGKGTLTTNNHTNDYNFIWAIEDGKLLIETDWLYDLENSYEYSLDQGSGTLTLKEGENEHIFHANFANN